jgi:hypothetical protein
LTCLPQFPSTERSNAPTAPILSLDYYDSINSDLSLPRLCFHAGERIYNGKAVLLLGKASKKNHASCVSERNNTMQLKFLLVRFSLARMRTQES